MAGKLAEVIPRPGRLDKTGLVAAELARIYRDSRTGRISIKDGATLAYILSVLARVLEQTDLEARLEALERDRGI